MKPLQTSHALEATIRDWFTETAEGGAPGYLDETLARIDRTQQRRDVLVRRGIVPVTAPALPAAARLLVAAAILLALLVAAVLAFGSRTPPLPPELDLGALILYDAAGDIHVVGADGGGARALTTTADVEFGPTWSPGGDRIAYWSAPTPDGRGASLWLMQANGTDARRVTPAIVFDVDPTFPAASFSPDGRQLAFATVDGHLWVVEVDGSGLRELGDTALRRHDPAWSPTGDLIAFFGEGATGVYVIGADGSGETRVSSGDSVPVSLRLPAWSPDGRQLTYHVQPTVDDSDLALATLGPSGWSQAIVIGGPTNDAWPRFSPDGRQLVFIRSSPGIAEGTAWVAAVDGSAATQVGTDLLGWAPVCLSPEGTAVLGVGGEGGVAVGAQALPRLLILHLGRDSPATAIDAPGRRSFAACSWKPGGM